MTPNMQGSDTLKKLFEDLEQANKVCVIQELFALYGKRTDVLVLLGEAEGPVGYDEVRLLSLSLRHLEGLLAAARQARMEAGSLRH
jgi:hypothetical protein